jgi:hypothetical protein
MNDDWGRPFFDLPASRTLLIAGLLLAVSLWLIGTGYDSAMARVRYHQSRCLRTGPHPSGRAMWSDDGEHWHYAD